MAYRTGAHRIAVLVLVFTTIAPRGASSSGEVATLPTAVTRPCAPAVAATAAPAFLRSRCATTLYPAVCYDSLLPYAGAFQTSHVRLARAAADIAVARLRAFSASLDGLVHRAAGTEDIRVVTPPPRVAAALRDCAGTISSAAGLARRSSAALGRLDAATAPGGSSGAAGGRLARWEVSNAQTWLSAAMANEATCADGFADAGNVAAVAPTAGIKEVATETVNVSKYTSNALALVNGIPL